ncbi:IS982 family transposase [Lewinella sp. IMCC34191]|uniref:IS982 family transposase n=1 Tax=Lewinella sp. IMCC34191 TaxID=2259172 RepID=UPI000E250797|nr:IS982 family transposase [Lewinella sp. IMCC34191]
MSISEVLTLIIFYQYSGYKCFEYYYEDMMAHDLRTYFPRQVGYRRFLQLITKAVPHLYVFAKWRCLNSETTGTYFVDSKKLPVCHNRRIHQHQVFRGLAERGYTSTGWFYGLKLHLIINNLGQAMNFTGTPGNVADANAGVLRALFAKLTGNCYGDKRYSSSIFAELYEQGIKLVTRIRKSMKNKLMPLKENMRYSNAE